MDNLKLITDRFGTDYKSASHDEITFNCPFCISKRGKADNDHKLYVNTKSLKFHCFKCNSSGRLNSVTMPKDFSGELYEILWQLKSPDYVDADSCDEDGEDNIFYLPVNKIEKGTVAYDYCVSRGITEDLINYYDIRLGVGELMGRIVIPNQVINNCWTDMYSARSMIGQIPKYKNPTGAKKNKLVFNLDKISDGQEKIIIVEGVITAICGGKDCVAVYGCHPSHEQLDQIVSKNPKSIYVCLDGDSAGQSGMVPTLTYLLNRFKGTLYAIAMPEGEDACDMGYKRFRAYIEANKMLYQGEAYYELSKILANT